MVTIWKWLDGHKSAIGATLNAILMWVVIKGVLDSDTATFVATLLTIWTGVAVGHNVRKSL
jgi:hypothetical protein